MRPAGTSAALFLALAGPLVPVLPTERSSRAEAVLYLAKCTPGLVTSMVIGGYGLTKPTSFPSTALMSGAAAVALSACLFEYRSPRHYSARNIVLLVALGAAVGQVRDLPHFLSWHVLAFAAVALAIYLATAKLLRTASNVVSNAQDRDV
jgi:hypothetical protein